MKFLIKFYAKKTINAFNIEKGISYIENAINEPMSYSINDLGKPFNIESRLDFISNTKDVLGQNIPLITNAKEGRIVVFSGVLMPYSTTDMWYLLLKIEDTPVKLDLINLFSDLCNTFESYWSKVTPKGIEGRFTRQSFKKYQPKSKKDLPKLPSIETFDTPYIPAKLGWLNYWPAPALKRIGFKQQHRALFHNVQDAANGGLILQITKEPLDFEMEGHLSKTVAIYDALPAIGGRDCVKKQPR